MSEAESIREGRRKPRVGLWLAAAAMVCLLTLLVAGGMWQARQEGQVASRIADIESSGQPLSAGELEKFYAYPPKGEDVTQLWLDGIAPLALPAFAQAAKGVPIVGDSE